MKQLNIAIASDHSGYILKEKIISHFNDNNIISYIDLGTNTTETVDYPIYAKKLAYYILENHIQFGILVCGTGIGMSIVANRISGIRAAVCTNVLMAEMARAHNDANILVLGAKIVTNDELAIKIINKFFDTQFEGGRHSTRLSQIS